MNRALRSAAKCAAPLLALCALVFDSSPALAITLTWVNFGSGNFNDPNNWFPSEIPGAGDFVSFEVGSANPYTVTFPGNDAFDPAVNYTTSELRVRNNGVTFSGSTQALRGPSTYTVASPDLTEANRGIIIGVFAGENALLNVSHSGFVCCGRLSSFSTAAATLGDGAGSSGTLNMSVGTFHVTGSGNESELIVGNHGTGTLNVNNGADVNVPGFVGDTALGNYDTGVGTVTVSGAGSTWYSDWRLYVGREGRGTVTIQNGGAYTGSITSVGTFAGATGTINVRGSGSTWTNNSGVFNIGEFGQGFLNIENGGVVSSSFGHLGLFSGSFGAGVVTGAGSRFNIETSLNVGGNNSGAGGNATLNISDGGVVAAGGLVRIFDAATLDGDGTIEGNVRNDGVVGPGNSAGVFTITGNYTQREEGYFSVEIFGVDQGTEYDLLDVGGVADLAGTVEVDVANDFTPMLGDTFEILRAAGGVVGNFDFEDFPTIGENIQLTAIYGPDNVTLAVVPIQTGDFNADGSVDAADYVVWRKNDGSQAGYETWLANFGATFDSGAVNDSTNAAVPEPTSLVMLLLTAAVGISRRPRRRVSPKLATT